MVLLHSSVGSLRLLLRSHGPSSAWARQNGVLVGPRRVEGDIVTILAFVESSCLVIDMKLILPGLGDS